MTKKTYLSHHGVRGQRWGLRRYQKEDGSLTAAGKRRYNVNAGGTATLKSRYRRIQAISGLTKTVIGTSLITKGVQKISTSNKTPDLSEKAIKKIIKKGVWSIIVGSATVGLASKNFINRNKNMTINTVGKGDSPETFRGIPKTRQEVLDSRKKK